MARILIVDDNSDLALVAAAVLEADGHDTAIAGDGVRAMTQLRAAAVDLAIVDIGLPGPLAGAALSEAIAREWPSLRVVFSSGLPASEFAWLPADASFLPKPYGMDDLLALMR